MTIEELKAQRDELNRKIEAMEKPFESLWVKLGSNLGYEVARIDNRIGEYSVERDKSTLTGCYLRRGKGQIVADFLNLMALLHSQEGVVMPEDGVRQYSIAVDSIGITALCRMDIDNKIDRTFAWYETEEHRDAAIAAAGEERIIQVMKNWHGVV